MTAYLVRTAVLVVALPCLGLNAAAAQDLLVEQGENLAAQWCAQCHAVGLPEQASALADAPSFKSLASEPGFDATRLKGALLSPHPAMPGFPLETDDIRALEAYMSTLPDDANADERSGIGPSHDLPNNSAVLVSNRAANLIENGRSIVERDCSPCHATSGAGPSPVEPAPAFSTLSENYPVAFLEEALAEGIMVDHPDVTMPEFVYGPDDISAIIAYLESVQGER